MFQYNDKLFLLQQSPSFQEIDNFYKNKKIDKIAMNKKKEKNKQKIEQKIIIKHKNYEENNILLLNSGPEYEGT